MTGTKNKIVLIRPRNIFDYYNYPPLNLVCIGSVLEKEGFEVKILDAGVTPDFDLRFERELAGALLVGFGMLTSEVPDAIELMKKTRQLSDVPIVAGGWHATLFPEQLATSDLVDYVVTGEGEILILELARQLTEGRLPPICILPRLYHDLDRLPQPNYDLVPDIEKYVTNYLTDRLSAYVNHPIRWLPYDSSRGCPSHCTFCINVVAENRKYRKKSAAKVVEESALLVDRYGLTHLKFIDDNYFVDIKRVRAIAEGLIQLGLHEKITYDCECRCDYFNDRMLNDETLALLRKSGLVQLTLGIESGSLRTLEIMKKGITVQQAERAVQMCDKHGIIARSSFILEIPGDRRDDIEATIRFINRMREYPYFSCGVGTFRPYPRCELTTQLIEDGFLTEPTRLEEWMERKNIEMYTSAELKRPWQVDPDFSAIAAHYLNIESETRIGLHQLSSEEDRAKLRLLIEVAKIRNRNMDYQEGYDTRFYENFLKDFYTRKSSAGQNGQYPLADPDGDILEGNSDG